MSARPGWTAASAEDLTDAPGGDEPLHAFVSYRRTDSLSSSRSSTRLRRSGQRTWVDTADIAAGEEWWTAIEAAIMAASVVLCMVTSDYPASPTCLDEVRFARAHGKRIVPVLLGLPPGGAAMPPEIAELDWIEAVGPAGPLQTTAETVADIGREARPRSGLDPSAHHVVAAGPRVGCGNTEERPAAER